MGSLGRMGRVIHRGFEGDLMGKKSMKEDEKHRITAKVDEDGEKAPARTGSRARDAGRVMQNKEQDGS